MPLFYQPTTVSLIRNETPGGSVNGSNTAFTTAAVFATGSLKVYLNGQRLTGSGNDYTEGTQGFTMTIAPLTGDVLLVDYETNNSNFIQGSNSSVVNETPTGSVNGSNTSFTTLLQKYVANSLEVYINGVQQIRGTDYTETTPNSGVFTMTTAPATGQVLRVNYQFSTGALGNADTVDGFHANATATANTLLPLDGSGHYPVSTLNTGAQNAVVATAETTTSTSYVDLTTTTDSVTVTIGANGLALVCLYGDLANASASSQSFIAFAISGANTASATDAQCLKFVTPATTGANWDGAYGAPILLTGLTPGSTTFKMKYRVNAGTGSFSNRRIAVIPL